MHLQRQINFEKNYYTIEFWGKRTDSQLEGSELLQLDSEIFQDRFGTKFRFLQQVHGDQILELPINTANKGLVWAEADAFISTSANLAAIRVADCIPILFFNGAAGAKILYGGIHAGWRGLKANILAKVIDQLADLTDIHQITFWVGPHIGMRYEVGIDVFQHFAADFYVEHTDSSKRYLDLAKILRAQFAEKNIRGENILWQNHDTLTSEGFFSHRGGDKGRNVALVYATNLFANIV